MTMTLDSRNASFHHIVNLLKAVTDKLTSAALARRQTIKPATEITMDEAESEAARVAFEEPARDRDARDPWLAMQNARFGRLTGKIVMR
jgi:hypothetical protein